MLFYAIKNKVWSMNHQYFQLSVLSTCKAKTLLPFLFDTILFFPLGVQDVIVRCRLNHMQCIGTKKCIHFNKLCNGARDCDDGFDEGVHCRGKSELPSYPDSFRLGFVGAVMLIRLC